MPPCFNAVMVKTEGLAELCVTCATDGFALVTFTGVPFATGSLVAVKVKELSPATLSVR